ncbi:hypothetical protein ARMSODRAFT_540427 [Armillaria solidipes]|uniref:Uncharacterized protein n=1 Tax=Armillaria solidipes TaxID=1076256 RepID=A0A2H3BFH8_9AGAR|nr:hypothetical protein ARMSODRAFT_540427 [Armillaria solidipes]
MWSEHLVGSGDLCSKNQELLKTLKQDRSIPSQTTHNRLNSRHNAERYLGRTRICSVFGQAGQRPYSLESREMTMQLNGKNDSSSSVTAPIRSLLEGQAPTGRVLWAVPTRKIYIMSTHHHICCQDAKDYIRLSIYEITLERFVCSPTFIQVAEARERKTRAEEYNERTTSYAELTN